MARSLRNPAGDVAPGQIREAELGLDSGCSGHSMRAILITAPENGAQLKGVQKAAVIPAHDFLVAGVQQPRKSGIVFFDMLNMRGFSFSARPGHE
jgi:hypothetical protein